MNTLYSNTIVAFLSFAVLFPITVTAASSCLPLTTNLGLCAVAPGTKASDGFDDVCNLVGCCKGPADQRPQTVKLPSGVIIDCKNTVCPNICKLSIARMPLGGESCLDTCTCADYTVPTTQAAIQPKLVQAAKLASIAYCLDFMTGLQSPGLFCGRFCNEFPKARVHSVFDASKMQHIGGYIIVDDDPSDPKIVIAFRGTNLDHDEWNLLEDVFLALGAIWFPDALFGTCYLCPIANEANDLGKAVYNYILPLLVDAINGAPCHRIQVIGHSLGGVVAEMIAVALKVSTVPELLHTANDVELITFAQPRLGSPSWASYVDSLLANEGKNWRVTHKGDPIPILDPAAYQQHSATEYYINDFTSDAKSAVVQCSGDEDTTCSKSWSNFFGTLKAPQTWVGQHTNYFMNNLGSCKP